MTSRIKPTSYQIQVKIFESAGCTYIRTRGDHLVYHYPGQVGAHNYINKYRASGRRKYVYA